MSKFGHIQWLPGLTEEGRGQVFPINQVNHSGRFYREVWIKFGGTCSAIYTTEVSGEEYYMFTVEESEKVEIQRLAERLDGDLELAVRHLAEKMREKQG